MEAKPFILVEGEQGIAGLSPESIEILARYPPSARRSWRSQVAHRAGIFPECSRDGPQEGALQIR